jgi:copper chaperone
MTQTYRVGGMTCGGCVSAVTRAIRRLDPEAAVAVDLAAGKVSVGSTLAEDAVQRAVEAAGFVFEGA